MLNHILYHKSLLKLEKKLNYSFRDRQLLEVSHNTKIRTCYHYYCMIFLFQRALTEPSYSQLYTVLAEQVKVTASNCGIRRPLVRAGKSVKSETKRSGPQPEIERLRQNEQLEFLGDAALEYLCRFNVCLHCNSWSIYVCVSVFPL